MNVVIRWGIFFEANRAQLRAKKISEQNELDFLWFLGFYATTASGPIRGTGTLDDCYYLLHKVIYSSCIPGIYIAGTDGSFFFKIR